MELSALSEINQKFVKNQLSNKTNAVQSNPIKPNAVKQGTETDKFEASKAEKPNNGKKILIILGVLAAIAVAAYAIFKNRTISLEKFKESGVFDKGKAIFKDRPFDGKIAVGADNAKKVLTYKKGNLLSAASEGVLKKYNYDPAGKLAFVDKFINNEFAERIEPKTVKINLLQNKSELLQNTISGLKQKTDILEDRIKLNELYHNEKNYTFNEFYDKAVNNIKNKTKADHEKIADILEHKDKMEYIAKSRELDKANAILKAQQAQALYNAKLEEKLSKKSAQESAKVFKEVFHEADARLAQEKEIKNARKAQDALIKFMQHPSGKKAEASAKVFMEKLPELQG